MGAVVVTYGVGAFSLLNPVAGSFVEHSPVVVINGAPCYKEQLESSRVGLKEKGRPLSADRRPADLEGAGLRSAPASRREPLRSESGLGAVSAGRARPGATELVELLQIGAAEHHDDVRSPVCQ